MKNYYRILNIQKTTANEDIKKAYRQAALFWHPDKNKSADAHDKFIEVNEAYSILINIEKREIYDRMYDTFFNSKQDLSIFKETNKEYHTYEQWVKYERAKAERLAKKSSDEILTDMFYFIDKYSWLLLLAFFGACILFAKLFEK